VEQLKVTHVSARKSGLNGPRNDRVCRTVCRLECDKRQRLIARGGELTTCDSGSKAKRRGQDSNLR
jgi:hypothetical protein